METLKRLFGSFAIAAFGLTAVANAGTVLDFTDGSGDTSGSIGQALYQTSNLQPAGTGFRRSFVRLERTQNATENEGYNTDARPLQMDENTSAQFTRSLNVNDLASVMIGNTSYYQFMLDINQTGANPDLSMTDLQVYLRSAANLTGFDTTAGTFSTGDLVYRFGSGDRVDLTFDKGSGDEDLFVFIPKALFVGPNEWVYLYSKFGAPEDVTAPPYPNNDGYEEWAALSGTTPVPLPAAAWGGLALLGALGVNRMRRRA